MSSNSVLLLVLIGFAVLVITIRLYRWLARAPSRSPARYVPRESLLTPAEQAFYWALRRAFAGEDYASRILITCQVRLADVVKVDGPPRSKEWWRAFGRISQKHLDFVICERSTFRVLCAIELHDSSHRQSARRERDALVRSVMQQAGVPLLEFRAQTEYDEIDLKLALRRALGASLRESRASPLVAS